MLGTAAGAAVLASVVRRLGPRAGLALGYAVATLAISVAVLAIFQPVSPVRHRAVFLGVEHGSNRLARYVAADLYPPERRATLIGWSV